MKKSHSRRAVRREEVVEAFKSLKEGGVENPWTQNEQTKKAWDLYNAFTQTLTESADPYLMHQQISTDILMIDAGFATDEDSLETILDFLGQDLQSAEEAGNEKAAAQLKEKIAHYEKMLN